MKTVTIEISEKDAALVAAVLREAADYHLGEGHNYPVLTVVADKFHQED